MIACGRNKNMGDVFDFKLAVFFTRMVNAFNFMLSVYMLLFLIKFCFDILSRCLMWLSGLNCLCAIPREVWRVLLPFEVDGEFAILISS